MNMQIASSERSASADRTWTVLDLLRWTTQHFAERGIDMDHVTLYRWVQRADRRGPPFPALRR